MAPPEPRDPNAPGYRPMVFVEDYEKIGRDMAAQPTLNLFESDPAKFDPKVEGARRFTMQRDRLEQLSREQQSGYLGQSQWERMDGPLTPEQQDIREQRANDNRAARGGLPDAPDPVPPPTY